MREDVSCLQTQVALSGIVWLRWTWGKDAHGTPPSPVYGPAQTSSTPVSHISAGMAPVKAPLASKIILLLRAASLNALLQLGEKISYRKQHEHLFCGMEYRECLLLKHVPERGTYKHRVLAHLSRFFKKLIRFKAKIFHALKTKGYRFVILTQPVSVWVRDAPRTGTGREMPAWGLRAQPHAVSLQANGT